MKKELLTCDCCGREIVDLTKDEYVFRSINDTRIVTSNYPDYFHMVINGHGTLGDFSKQIDICADCLNKQFSIKLDRDPKGDFKQLVFTTGTMEAK